MRAFRLTEKAAETFNLVEKRKHTNFNWSKILNKRQQIISFSKNNYLPSSSLLILSLRQCDSNLTKITKMTVELGSPSEH